MLDRAYLDFGSLAVLSIILFTPTLVSFVISEPGVVWPEYSGVLAPPSRSPEWTRPSGRGSWLDLVALNVRTGIMAINGVQYEVPRPVRLAGHVLAGIWIAASSACARQCPSRVVGILTGVWPGGYNSFAADVAPRAAIYPRRTADCRLVSSL